MPTFRFRCSTSYLSAADIKALRPYVQMGIAELRRRAATGASVIEITPFRGDWQSQRGMVSRIMKGIADGTLPLLASESSSGMDEPLDVEQLRTRLHHLRKIEVETQMHTELELGSISTPEEFVPYDEDWIF